MTSHQSFGDPGFEPCLDEYAAHLTALNKIVIASGDPMEGNLFHFNLETPDLRAPDPRYRYKRFNFAFACLAGRRLLEVGFNAGHSAMLALTCNPELTYVGVDLARHRYTAACFDYLKSVFGSRISLIPGDSRETLPAIENLETFDLFHVDGGHDFDVVVEDLRNIAAGARPGSRIVIDDMTGTHLRVLCDFYVAKGTFAEIRPTLWQGVDQALFLINSKS